MFDLKRTICPLLVLASLASAGAVQAATYYVDRLLPGSDGNNGTSEAAPFLTIPKCVAVAINPGDTCLVKNGRYPEGVVMRHSGIAGNPITLKNYPGDSPVLAFNQPTDAAHRLELLSINTYPSVIQYVTIQGLEITGSGRDGIKINSGDHIIISQNYVHDNGGYDPTGIINGNGILSVGCFKCTIDRNIIYHNGNFSVPLGHGLYLYGSGWTVTNNLIYYNARYGIQTSSHAFDAANMANTNMAGWANGLIANNTIAYNNQRAGIVIWDAGSGPSLMSGIRIYNNILYENATISDNSATANGIQFMVGGSPGVVVSNNIAYASGIGATNFIVGGTSGSTYILSGNSTTTNPNMANAPATVPASPDFHPKAGSMAIDYGVDLKSVGVTTDYKGLPRPQGGAFDVGAYEVSGDTTSPSPPQGLQVR